MNLLQTSIQSRFLQLTSHAKIRKRETKAILNKLVESVQIFSKILPELILLQKTESQGGLVLKTDKTLG